MKVTIARALMVSVRSLKSWNFSAMSTTCQEISMKHIVTQYTNHSLTMTVWAHHRRQSFQQQRRRVLLNTNRIASTIMRDKSIHKMLMVQLLWLDSRYLFSHNVWQSYSRIWKSKLEPIWKHANLRKLLRSQMLIEINIHKEKLPQIISCNRKSSQSSS